GRAACRAGGLVYRLPAEVVAAHATCWRSACKPVIRGRLDLERVDLAPLVMGLELPVVDLDLTVVLDADLPVRRLRAPAESAPVADEPLVDPRGSGALDLLGIRPVRLDQPVDVLRSVTPGVVDVELTPPGPLRLLPVDFLATRLDDVEIQIDVVGVP